MTDDTSAVQRPETINRLRRSVLPALAMLAGMQLDVFTPLKDGPLSAERLAATLGVKSEKLAPLLYTLVTTGLIETRDGVFANSAEADRFLVRGAPDYLDGQRERFAEHWHAVLQTAETIRTGTPQAKHDFASMGENELEAFFRRSHPGTLAAGRELAARFDLSSRRALLDVAGGSGGVSISLCKVCPRLRATVADLPGVTPITRRFVAEAGAADRIEIVEADLLAKPPQGSYDMAVLMSFVQILAPDDARRAVANVGRVVEPGGAIHIIGNGVLDDSRISPPENVAHGLVFLNFYDDGRAYTEGEYREILAAGGFVGVERMRLDSGLNVVSARKPG
jgi:predicted O-methyltransferase YrrM